MFPGATVQELLQCCFMKFAIMKVFEVYFDISLTRLWPVTQSVKKTLI